MKPEDEDRAEFYEYLARREAEDWDKHWLDQVAEREAGNHHDN